MAFSWRESNDLTMVCSPQPHHQGVDTVYVTVLRTGSPIPLKSLRDS